MTRLRPEPDPRLPSKLYSADGTRAIDRAATEVCGIPALNLMRAAGNVCFRALRDQWPEANRVAVVCGTGNNGGDGFVIASLALAAGLDVRVAIVGDRGRMAETAAACFDELSASHVEYLSVDAALTGAEVIVDALLGTGLARPLQGDFHDAVAAINAHPAPVLAVDIPTGIDADTGAVTGGEAIRAQLTCTFIALKPGLVTGAGASACGQLMFESLGVPGPAFAETKPVAARVDAAVLPVRLPLRRHDAHKGDFGHALLVGGDRPYAGAVLLSARACLASGAGLVSVATRAEHAVQLVGAAPEAMWAGVTHPDELDALAERASVLAIGPGLGTDDWGRALLERAIRQRKPTVIDADGLNLLAREGAATGQLPVLILTPHPGEAARLLDVGVSVVQRNRVAAAQRIAAEFDAICVLKGAGTVVAAPDRLPSVATVGNPGLAAGGSGDTLTGIIAALLAQSGSLGLDGFGVAETAVCAHGAAADVAASQGERGLTATQVINALRGVLNPRALR